MMNAQWAPQSSGPPSDNLLPSSPVLPTETPKSRLQLLREGLVKLRPCVIFCLCLLFGTVLGLYCFLLITLRFPFHSFAQNVSTFWILLSLILGTVSGGLRIWSAPYGLAKRRLWPLFIIHLGLAFIGGPLFTLLFFLSLMRLHHELFLWQPFTYAISGIIIGIAFGAVAAMTEDAFMQRITIHTGEWLNEGRRSWILWWTGLGFCFYVFSLLQR